MNFRKFVFAFVIHVVSVTRKRVGDDVNDAAIENGGSVGRGVFPVPTVRSLDREKGARVMGGRIRPSPVLIICCKCLL